MHFNQPFLMHNPGHAFKISKHYVKLFTFIIALGIFFPSCDPCYNLDCLADNYHGQFRIVSASDGRDLVFGTSKIYDKDRIRFYSLNGVDTTFFSCEYIKFPDVGYDSILFVYFFPKTDVAYMNLGNGDIDTLTMSYNTVSTKCCGSVTEITNFRFNNSINIPGNSGTQEIRK